jgi:hypothetical protein
MTGPQFGQPRNSLSILFPTASRPAPYSSQSPNKWVSGAFSPAVRQSEPKAVHSSVSGAEAKSEQSNISSMCLRGV